MRDDMYLFKNLIGAGFFGERTMAFSIHLMVFRTPSPSPRLSRRLIRGFKLTKILVNALESSLKFASRNPIFKVSPYFIRPF